MKIEIELPFHTQVCESALLVKECHNSENVASHRHSILFTLFWEGWGGGVMSLEANFGSTVNFLQVTFPEGKNTSK